MKRFTLPIVFVLMGVFLVVTYIAVNKVMDQSPLEWGTGLVGCENPQPNSSAPCKKGIYVYDGPYFLRVAISIGLMAGVVLVPSGVAIGVYRFSNTRHTNSKHHKS